jgi:hypothetical protein
MIETIKQTEPLMTSKITVLVITFGGSMGRAGKVHEIRLDSRGAYTHKLRPLHLRRTA